jgi:hypothetical protein
VTDTRACQFVPDVFAAHRTEWIIEVAIGHCAELFSVPAGGLLEI